MDCPKCNLRYNIATRKPKVHQCGHSLCQACSNKLVLCPTCNVVFDKSKATLNHALMEMLTQKKTTKDIDKLIKVCFVGESKAGKTSLINRLKGEQFKQNTITTIGYDFAFQDRVIDGLNVRFQLWDSAGQERYRAVSPLHYKNSDLIVILYDVTQSARCNNVAQWLQQANHHSPEDIIKLLVGNKIDLMQEKYANFQPLDQATWAAIANKEISKYYVSCKTYEGVEEFWSILESQVKIILKRIIIKGSPFNQTSLTQRESRPKKKSQSIQTLMKLNKNSKASNYQSRCC